MGEPQPSTEAQSALRIKLTQLAKVIEYLSFHINEHYFQVEELQKVYEKEEDKITYDTQIEIESIYSQFGNEKNDLIKNIDYDYKKQIDDLKDELRQTQNKLVEETKSAIRKISNDLDYYQGKIKRINREMRKQIAFMQDNTKVDPMNVQKKLRETIENHRITLNAHDTESQRKQNLFNEQSLNNQNEINKKYMKTINDLKRKLRPPPQIRNQIIQSLKQLTDEIFNLRNELNKIRSQAKKLATATFSEKLVSIYDVTNDMKKENEEFPQSYDKLKNSLQETIFQIKSEKKQLLNQLRNQQVQFSDEINKLEEELKCVSDPVYLAKKVIKEKESDIEKHILGIQKQIDEIKDLDSLHEKEKNELKLEFERDIQNENESFEQKKKSIEEKISFQKTYEEKLKEKEGLLQYKTSLTLHQPSISIGQISIKTEINEIESLFNKEFSKVKMEKKSSISNYFTECDIELDRKKEEAKNEYENQILLISKEFKENDVIQNISKHYKELFLSLETQLSQIEIPKKDENDQITSEIKKHQDEFKSRIDQERSELIQKFEEQIKNEEERFQNSPSFLDNTDYSNLLLEEKNKKKQYLAKYDEQIASLESDKDKIEEKIILDESLKKLEDDSHFQIKQALQQKTDASKSMIAKITACSERYSNMLHEEMMSNSALSFQSTCDKCKNDAKISQDKIEHQINMEKKNFERKSKSIKNTFSKESKKIQKEILAIRNSMKEDENQFNIDKQHSQSHYDMMIAKTESEIVSNKPIAIPAQMFYQYDNKIAQLQREKERKMRIFNDGDQMPTMREEERIKIDELEIQLCDLSRELAQLSKNLVIAREISLREKEKKAEIGDARNETNQIFIKRNVSSSLGMTVKPKRQVVSSVEIKRPNMSRTAGQILNLK